MRKPLLLCAALALAAGVVSIVLWRELRAERDFSAGLQVQLEAAEPDAPGPTTLFPVAAPTAPASVRPATTASAPAVLSALNERERLKDAEYREARLLRLRLQVPETHPGLVEELGLSAEQAEELFDLLAEIGLESASGPILVPGANGSLDAEQVRHAHEMQTRHESRIASMLGDATYARWQEYQESQPARLRVVQLSRSMEAAGVPLTSAQMKPLTDLLLADHAHQRQERRATLFAPGPNGQPADAQAAARLQEERMMRQSESNRRLVDVAAAYLDARQLDLFRKSLDAQLAMNRASSRLQSEAQASLPAP